MPTLTPYTALRMVQDDAFREGSFLGKPAMYMDHVIGVFAYCSHIVESVLHNGRAKPEEIDPEFMKLVSILHDIGRPWTDDRSGPDVHEIVGGNLLVERGFQDIGYTVGKHFVAHEKAQLLKDGKISAPGFGTDIEPERYLQDDLPSTILTVADLSVGSDGAVVGWQRKLPELVKKYESPERARPEMVEILNAGGLERMRELCERFDQDYLV